MDSFCRREQCGVRGTPEGMEMGSHDYEVNAFALADAIRERLTGPEQR